MITERELLSSLGTYLSKHLAGDPWLRGLMRAQLALQDQAEQDLQEMTLSAFRKHIPVYHLEKVYTFTLDPANRNDTIEAVPKHGGENLYFLDEPANPNWLTMCSRYGVPAVTGAVYALPLSDVVSIEKIVDNPVRPSLELLPGRDFELVGGAVAFKEDPCRDGLAREFFLVNVRQDFRWIYKHFGYILGLNSKSSEAYRAIIDAIFNAFVDGASQTNIKDILKEVTGNLTGENIKFIPLNRLNSKEDVKAVLIPKRFLGPDYYYGLVFVNENLPLQELNGQLRFYVGGNANDVSRFWRDFEEHCEAMGTTVNEVLTLCAVESRTAINPYHFFAEHIGRYHYTLVSIDYTDYPSDLTLDHMPLRHLTPPWSALLLQQNVTLDMEADVTGESDDQLDFSNTGFMELNLVL